MNEPAGYDRAKEVFLAACELPAADRSALLDLECGDDDALRRRVESLLALDEAATDVGTTTGYSGPSAYGRPLPERIGPYRITGLIGEGGMGTVYEAVQRRPQRQVALKVVRGMQATAAAMRRFEREVELLGRLRHPQMAQIYDAGVHHEDGLQSRPLPYFALELVNGKPITDYAREKQLSLDEKLRLIIRLCDAVGYAHRKGVIHLDLKPGNILVDYAGHPKILDFGIARATEWEPAETIDPDRPRVVMGTVPYMSPEQIRGEPHEIDTRADIYALGAVCYELLTGRTPHGTEDLPPDQAVDVVLERDPIAINSVAPHHVPRDLQRIVYKALQRSREDRYQTTQEFALDLERFLAGLPVSVTPHTAAYVTRLFAARHRFIVAAALIVLAMLLGMGARLAAISVAAGRAAVQRDAMQSMIESLLLELPAQGSAGPSLETLINWRDGVQSWGDSDGALFALLNVAIARRLLEDDQPATARGILIPVADRLQAELGPADSRTNGVARLLVECFTRLGDTDRAARWQGIADGSAADPPPPGQ